MFLVFKDKTVFNSFVQHMNNSDPNIKFTMETKHNETLPFLDSLIIRQSDGTLTTQVYRKPTYTEPGIPALVLSISVKEWILVSLS